MSRVRHIDDVFHVPGEKGKEVEGHLEAAYDLETRQSIYVLVRPDGSRERLLTCRIHVHGLFPLAWWSLEQTWPPEGILARGWALTRSRARTIAREALPYE